MSRVGHNRIPAARYREKKKQKLHWTCSRCDFRFKSPVLAYRVYCAACIVEIEPKDPGP